MVQDNLSKLKWCFKQKRGISFIDYNHNLSNAYLLKSENSIKVMRNQSGNIEWEIVSAYYSVYYSIYVILMRIGIKSEIHSSSIDLIEFLFNEKFNLSDIKLLRNLKKLREKVQYYIFEDEEVKGYKLYIEEVLDFNLKCRKIIGNLDEMKIKFLISKAKEVLE